MITKIKRICLNCQKEFWREPWRHQKFCSVICGISFRQGKTYDERICLNCGGKFKVEPWRHQKFCSQQCGVDYRKGITYETKICPQCGMEFESERWKHQKFCSVECGTKYNNKPIYEKRKCLRCKKEFEVRSWMKKKFCSNECRIKYFQKEKNDHTHNRRKSRILIMINGRRILLHRYLVEQKLNRHLSSREQVHHIDLDSANNKIDNLWLYENATNHTKGHRSYLQLAPKLLKRGIIGFENGKYVLRRGGGKGRR